MMHLLRWKKAFNALISNQLEKLNDNSNDKCLIHEKNIHTQTQTNAYELSILAHIFQFP